MIFPKIKISDLEKDVQIKRANLDQSKGQLTQSIQEKTKPLVFLYNNRNLILTTIMTIFSSAKFLWQAGTNKKKSKSSGLFSHALKLILNFF